MSHPVCGTLLQQPHLTTRVTNMPLWALTPNGSWIPVESPSSLPPEIVSGAGRLLWRILSTQEPCGGHRVTSHL